MKCCVHNKLKHILFQFDICEILANANKLQIVIDAITVIHYGINIISMKYMG